MTIWLGSWQASPIQWMGKVFSKWLGCSHSLDHYIQTHFCAHAQTILSSCDCWHKIQLAQHQETLSIKMAANAHILIIMLFSMCIHGVFLSTCSIPSCKMARNCLNGNQGGLEGSTFGFQSLSYQHSLACTKFANRFYHPTVSLDVWWLFHHHLQWFKWFPTWLEWSCQF